MGMARMRGAAALGGPRVIRRRPLPSTPSHAALCTRPSPEPPVSSAGYALACCAPWTPRRLSSFSSPSVASARGSLHKRASLEPESLLEHGDGNAGAARDELLGEAVVQGQCQRGERREEGAAGHDACK